MTDTATISREVIEKYVLLGREIQDKTAERETIHDDLMIQIKSGAVCAGTCPWELYISKGTRTAVDWKGLALKLLPQVYGAGWMDHLNSIKRMAQVETYSLLSRANPRYGLIAREWPSDGPAVSTENGD